MNLYKEKCEELKIIANSIIRHHETVEKITHLFIECLSNGNKIILCGNGGSASDSIHIAAEFIGRFELERKSLPAISLASDISAITSIGNDYGFEYIFSRQIEGHGNKKDILVSLSTSGNSKNVINAVNIANSLDINTISFSGKGGGKLEDISNTCIVINSESTARIQEAHKFILHYICGRVDEYFSN